MMAPTSNTSITVSTPRLYSSNPLARSTSSIRLIELLQENKDATVKCRFHVFKVSEAPPFIALSYTWGPESPVHEIQIDGENFCVRANLWEALRAIRSLEKRSVSDDRVTQLLNLKKAEKRRRFTTTTNFTPVMYWVDQICVNQEDISEKNHQVSLMQDIYQTATMVLVWLGVTENATTEAAAVKFIEKTVRIDCHSYNDIPTFSAQHGFMNLCKRPYWSRMWVVQEIILAKEVCVLSGRYLFSFQKFQSTLDYLESYRSNNSYSELYPHSEYSNYIRFVEGFLDGLHGSGAGTMLWTKEILDMHRAANHNITLHLLITLYKKQECGDIRDKVFGLLSLLSRNTTHGTPLAADYSKTSAEVYSMAMHSAIIHEKLEVELFFEYSDRLLELLNLDHSVQLSIEEQVHLISHAIVTQSRESYQKFPIRLNIWMAIFKKSRSSSGGWYLHLVSMGNVVFRPITQFITPANLAKFNMDMVSRPEVLVLRGYKDHLSPDIALILVGSSEIVAINEFLSMNCRKMKDSSHQSLRKQVHHLQQMLNLRLERNFTNSKLAVNHAAKLDWANVFDWDDTEGLNGTNSLSAPAHSPEEDHRQTWRHRFRIWYAQTSYWQ